MRSFKESVLYLIKLNSTPQGIALGVAIGVFIGITPLYGFHTLMVILFAMMIPRTNKVAILAGTNISIPPTTPFITWAGYSIGRVVLGNGYPPLGWSMFKSITYDNASRFYFALLVGSLILGVFCAVIFYFITFIAMKNIKKNG